MSVTIHKYFGVFPFVAMVLIATYILSAVIQLGYAPTYGGPPDPSAFGYMPLHFLGFIFCLLSIPASAAWIFATIHGIIAYRTRFKINYTSTSLFFIGVFSYIALRYAFTEIYEWYMD